MIPRFSLLCVVGAVILTQTVPIENEEVNERKDDKSEPTLPSYLTQNIQTKSELNSTEINNHLNVLENTNLSSATPDEIASFAQSLSDVTANVSRFSQSQVSRAVELTNSLVVRLKANGSVLPRVLQNTTSAIGSLAVTKDILTSDHASKLQSNIQTITDIIPATENGTVTATDNLALGTMAVKKRNNCNNTFFSFVLKDSEQVSDAYLDTTNDLRGAKVAISVRCSDIASDRIDFTLLPNDNLFLAIEPQQISATRRIISRVIAASTKLNNKKRDTGTHPVRLQFSFKAQPEGQIQCTFWNSKTKDWDSEGCHSVDEFSNSSLHVCECSHLTSFCVIFSQQGFQLLSPGYKEALSILTHILLPVSCVALFATIVIYIIYLQTIAYRYDNFVLTQAGQTLVSLCSTLLAGHLTFLLGSLYDRAGDLCTAIGVLLHFFYVSTFAWSMVEGTNIFLSFIWNALSNHMPTEVPHYFLKASVFAWGVPAIIVVITLATAPNFHYGRYIAEDKFGKTTPESICFLNPTIFYFAFFIPLLVSLVFNGIILVLLAVGLYRYRLSRMSRRSGGIKQRVIGFIGICVLLNMSWMLGALNVLFPMGVMMIFFTIINGLQGLMIFVFYCLLRKEIRRLVKKLKRKSLNSEAQPTKSGCSAFQRRAELSEAGVERHEKKVVES